MSEHYVLKVGNVVNLKSGGPDMTVYAIDDELTHCVYWNKQEAKYEYIALMPDY